MGLFLARNYNSPPNLLLLFALIGSLTALVLAYKGKSTRLWFPVFIISATLCFWYYGSVRLKTAPTDFEYHLPQREAQLRLKIKTIIRSTDHYERTHFIAQVLHAPKIGQLKPRDLIYVCLKLPKQVASSKKVTIPLQQGLQVNATGVITIIPKTKTHVKNRDFNNYLRNIGIYYRLDRISKLQTAAMPPPFDQFCSATNKKFQKILRLGVPDKHIELANTYIAILLGQNKALNKTQRERYHMTGTMHFFAISGLHIGVIAAVISKCLLLIRTPRSWSPWIGLPLLYLYVEITGASPSAIRALLMTVFFWFSFAFGRQHAPFAALINSAIVVLLIYPGQLWSLGFQLSYVVVASILLFGLPLHFFLKKSFQPYQWLPKESWTQNQRIICWLCNKIYQLFAISFSAWLASAPLCIAFFNFVAPGAIALNILLVGLVAIVVVSGITAIGLATLLLPSVAEFINNTAWVVISVMDGIVYLGTKIPKIVFPDGVFLTEFTYFVLVAYFLSLLWLHRYPRKIQTHRI